MKKWPDRAWEDAQVQQNFLSDDKVRRQKTGGRLEEKVKKWEFVYGNARTTLLSLF